MHRHRRLSRDRQGDRSTAGQAAAPSTAGLVLGYANLPEPSIERGVVALAEAVGGLSQ
jgi:hypothetical protein